MYLRINECNASCKHNMFLYMQIRCTSGNLYLLYALTVSGVAYLFKLRNIYTYESCSIFPSNDLIEFNLQTHPHYGEITAVAATSGSLVIGRSDGSVSLFQLGMFDQSAPGIKSCCAPVFKTICNAHAFTFSFNMSFVMYIIEFQVIKINLFCSVVWKVMKLFVGCFTLLEVSIK